MKKFAVALVLFLLVLVSSVTGSAAAGKGKKKLLNAQIDGSTPNVTIRGVTSGGAPWAVQEGKATVDSSGRIRVQVKGLLIASGVLADGTPVPNALVGTTGPVTMVLASLTCGGPGGMGMGFTIADTDPVPLSTSGDFQIDDTVTVPDVCDRPIVLIRIAGATAPGPFIAVSTPTDRSQHVDD